MVLANGFAWNGQTYDSLTKVAFEITGYDDGGYSGGSTDRPDVPRLLGASKIDIIVVYKVNV